jgi:uncharacterized small protein (DUF1192 family)
MSNNVKLELTPEQKKQIQEATGKDASVIEFSVEELEERIAPTTLGFSELEDRIAPATVLPTDAL